MTLLQSIFMGLIQGLTEFLPVSSSGHLALFKIMFHVNTDTGLLFDVLLHIGTLIAVFVVYWKDILRLILEFISLVIDLVHNVIVLATKKKNGGKYCKLIKNGYRKFVVLIIVSSIPTGIIGFVGADLVEAASEILLIPGICLIVTAALLWISDKVKDGEVRVKEASYTNAFIIGICQGIATLPGISRSGTTITACLLCGFDRKFAVKYSFILSIPAILGALVFQLKDLGDVAFSTSELGGYIVGMIVSAVVGYICIKTMLVVVRNKKFKFFSIYCLAVGILSVVGHFYMR